MFVFACVHVCMRACACACVQSCSRASVFIVFALLLSQAQLKSSQGDCFAPNKCCLRPPAFFFSPTQQDGGGGGAKKKKKAEGLKRLIYRMIKWEINRKKEKN